MRSGIVNVGVARCMWRISPLRLYRRDACRPFVLPLRNINARVAYRNRRLARSAACLACWYLRATSGANIDIGVTAAATARVGAARWCTWRWAIMHFQRVLPLPFFFPHRPLTTPPRAPRGDGVHTCRAIAYKTHLAGICLQPTASADAATATARVRAWARRAHVRRRRRRWRIATSH